MQLKLPEAELRRLKRRVEEDYNAAISDHQLRIERFRRYYRKWRNRSDTPAAGEEDEPNFRVPLLQWNTFGKWADDLGKLLGEDAEIVAKPTGPSDQKIVAKVGRYMTARVFQQMRLVNPFAVFAFRKTLFGKAFAYTPWIRDTYPEKSRDGKVTEATYFEGPSFEPLWPDDFIVPAEDVDTLQDFSFVIRRYRTTPDRIRRGERAGLYQGIEEKFQKLVDYADKGEQRDFLGEEIKREKDDAEGVVYESGLSGRNSLVVLEWYGNWRMLRGKKDAREGNVDARAQFESDLVIRWIPGLNWIVGVQDLMDLYPRMRHRRPFVEASLVKDGSYWPPGFGELLEQIEDEASVNHQLFTRAGQFSVGPVIFYKPSAGFDPDAFEYEPFQTYPTEDPAGVRLVQGQLAPEYSIVQNQTLTGYAERVTGQSDMTMGRTPERPNAPRTARGTIALLEQGSIRAALDTLVLREDMAQIITRFWELESSDLAPKETFFRVTEEEAGGLFDVRDGGASMTAQERGGKFDFDLKFATSLWSKEANKERQLQLYQIDLGNPLIINNPRALWLVTSAVHKALGDDHFADLIPEPPDIGLPKHPREEWTAALQGEPLAVHPMDDDDRHLADHFARMSEEQSAQEPDQAAIEAMIRHTSEHEKQKRQKMLMSIVTQQIQQTVAREAAAGGGSGMPLAGAMQMMGGGGQMGGGNGRGIPEERGNPNE